MLGDPICRTEESSCDCVMDEVWREFKQKMVVFVARTNRSTAPRRYWELHIHLRLAARLCIHDTASKFASTRC
jgi:hypothetical protein